MYCVDNIHTIISKPYTSIISYIHSFLCVISILKCVKTINDTHEYFMICDIYLFAVVYTFLKGREILFLVLSRRGLATLGLDYMLQKSRDFRPFCPLLRPLPLEQWLVNISALH